MRNYKRLKRIGWGFVVLGLLAFVSERTNFHRQISGIVLVASVVSLTAINMYRTRLRPRARRTQSGLP
jgi:hypothetical protein